MLHALLQSLTNAVEPGFYSTNWLFLGKAYLKLGEKVKAKEWLQKTVACNGCFAGDEEDKQVSVACMVRRSMFDICISMQVKHNAIFSPVALFLSAVKLQPLISEQCHPHSVHVHTNSLHIYACTACSGDCVNMQTEINPFL